MHKSSATKIDKYVTTNSFHEKVELRTYESGCKRAYIYQGKRWFIMELGVFEMYLRDETIFKEPEDHITWCRIIYKDYIGVDR